MRGIGGGTMLPLVVAALVLGATSGVRHRTPAGPVLVRERTTTEPTSAARP